MLPESNDRLICPRLTLMLAMCLTFVIRMRRMSLLPVYRSAP